MADAMDPLVTAKQRLADYVAKRRPSQVNWCSDPCPIGGVMPPELGRPGDLTIGDLRAIDAALSAVTSDRDRLERERDEAVAQARRDGMEDAARIVDEADATCEAGEKMARARGDKPSADELFARGVEARHIGRQIRAAALASRTGGRADG